MSENKMSTKNNERAISALMKHKADWSDRTKAFEDVLKCEVSCPPLVSTDPETGQETETANDMSLLKWIMVNQCQEWGSLTQLWHYVESLPDYKDSGLIQEYQLLDWIQTLPARGPGAFKQKKIDGPGGILGGHVRGFVLQTLSDSKAGLTVGAHLVNHYAKPLNASTLEALYVAFLHSALTGSGALTIDSIHAYATKAKLKRYGHNGVKRGQIEFNYSREVAADMDRFGDRLLTQGSGYATVKEFIKYMCKGNDTTGLQKLHTVAKLESLKDTGTWSMNHENPVSLQSLIDLAGMEGGPGTK